MKTKLFAALLALCLYSKAHAGFLVEPYLGYLSSTLDMELGAAAAPFNGQKITMGLTGPQFGLRLGYSFPVISLALDYATTNLSSTVKSKPDLLAVTGEDSKRNSLGITVAANLWLVKPYVGYIFDDQGKDDTSTTFGNGFKLGVGFSIIPMLKLNAEYQMMTYTKSESGGTTTTFGANEFFSSVKGSGFGLILSAPFSF